jgi:nucleotide-binding universal stress UspA family protein
MEVDVYKRILVPLDGSRNDAAVLEHIKTLARDWGATVKLIQLFRLAKAEDPFERQVQMEEGSSGYRARERAKIYLPRVEESLRSAGIDASSEFLATEELEADAIVRCAEEGLFDLIVLANQDRSAIGRFFFGNIEERVRRRSSLPVLFVPQPRL